jgi:hypothetical protein
LVATSIYEETGNAASTETIRSALDLLEARAQFDAPERPVHIRVGEHDGHIYLDLADKDWHAVQIGPDGWQVVTFPPVRFRRAAGMLPLPVRQRGGSIQALAAFLNLPAPDEFMLVAGWLLATLQQGGPYPLLVIAGEQESAKTMLTKILRALIDPNAAPTRASPPGSSRRASQPKPINCLPAANGCTKSSTTDFRIMRPQGWRPRAAPTVVPAMT